MKKECGLFCLLLLCLVSCSRVNIIFGTYRDNSTLISLNDDSSFTYKYDRNSIIDSISGHFSVTGDTVFFTAVEYIDSMKNEEGLISEGLDKALLIPQIAYLAKYRPLKLLWKEKRLYQVFDNSTEEFFKKVNVKYNRPYIALTD